MKPVEEIELPEGLRYSPDHQWVKPEDGLARVGITDYAQDQLGDVVYVDLPEVGVRMERGGVFATVESVKSVSDCISPLDGQIVAVNGSLADDPTPVNLSPYGEGWMVTVKPDDAEAAAVLLTAARYRALLKGEA